MFVIFAGLPGAGKSTIAQQLAREVGAVYLRIDSIEQAIRASGMMAPGAEMGEAVFAAADVAPLRDEDLRPFSGLASLAEQLKSGQKGGE